ncbi:uncharacterized protein SEPMUDRAFT_126155 [Sphaerulina musiva SO2202]|uniref:Uncharacterized protein n=1 Tax=Sphaerulina musiva (strain SO2202) TaxID=692275 RepID=N1QEY5_SPHMS|nr:uncharacterized protein SEPMUDRAFT_126155 [Sphaerulina musiva SO2202]EMF11697.1 hypothetical protein SEPMUDRAFT_126155 [Sphaerulina musiva SO2202]
MSSTNYQTHGFVDPAQAEDHFSQQFDMSNPEHARTSYQRLMHQHTKMQFETATASSRRRSPNPSSGSNDMASLSTESSRGSVGSMG